MSRLIYSMLLASTITVQTGTVLAHQNHNHSDRQVTRMHATIPGDPNFEINPKAIPRTKAVLERDEDGLGVTINSRELPPGAYTVWMRVFNQPELCIGGENVRRSVCSRGDDLPTGRDPAVPDASGDSTASVFWLTGAIVGEDGKAHISTSVDVNNWPGMVLLGADVAGTEKQAVWNPEDAEIHIVLRYHGREAAATGPIFLRNDDGSLKDISPEEEDAFFLLGRQLNRMLGNCSPIYSESPANCEDAQLAIFASPK